MAIVDRERFAGFDAPPGQLIVVRTPFEACTDLQAGLRDAEWAPGIVPVHALHGEHVKIGEDGKVLRGALDASYADGLFRVQGYVDSFKQEFDRRSGEVIERPVGVTDIDMKLFTNDHGRLVRERGSEIKYATVSGGLKAKFTDNAINIGINAMLSDPSSGIAMGVNRQLQERRVNASISEVGIGEVRGGGVGLVFTAQRWAR